MSKEKSHLDRKMVEKDPDYYFVESDDEVFIMIKGMLEETVYGQPEACTEVARSMARSLGELNDPCRPQFVGLFLGEPGVGKTEMGKAVAKVLDPLNYERRLKIVDCNMFQHSHDVERILGAPPSYVGYGDEPLIKRSFLVRQNVIVFDEIEKADPALHRLLLRIMDKGRLEINDNFDDEYDEETAMLDDGLPGLDFSKSTIILTSNIGSREIVDIKKGKKSIGFDLDDGVKQDKDVQKVGIEAVKKYWKHMPEFLDRIDSMVVFNSLTEEVVYRLIDKFLGEYNLNQRNDATVVMATDQLKTWIVSLVDAQRAGRELKRIIEKLIITPAAEVKLKMPKGMPLIADISQDEPKRVVFWVSKRMVKSGSK